MKLFTSRYSNPNLAPKNELVKVGITLGKPKFRLNYSVAEFVRMLAPHGSIFHLNDPVDFIPAFLFQLDRTGVDKIQAKLQQISGHYDGRDLVLLCFEDCRPIAGTNVMKDWCHRLVFAQWWQDRVEEEVLELEHMGVDGGVVWPSAVAKQLKLFS